MSATQASGATNKRQKSTDAGGQPPNGSYHQSPPYSQPQFQQAPYGGPQPPGGQQQFPMQHQSGYMWQPGQQQPPYGNQMPPHWQGGRPGPTGMYRQSPPPGVPPNGPPMPLDRAAANNWSGYRGQPPPQGAAPPPQGRRANTNKKSKAANNSGAGTPSNVPPAGYQPWGQPQGQWAQNQWGGGPPPQQMWQQGPAGPPMHARPQPSPPPGQTLPQHIQGQAMGAMSHQNQWSGSTPQASPKRQTKGRPRASPEPLIGAMYSQPGMVSGLPMDITCKPIGMDIAGTDQEVFLTTQGVGPGLDEESRPKPSGGSSVTSRDKGRGSYRCGRCGVPKKGHVCPYQPKLKRRPDEPPPETRNAAIQVEMDEFMTLRRLNIEIQGFPESYATGSHMIENKVIGEPHPMARGNFVGNAQLNIPPHVASQQTTPTPMAQADPDGVRSSPPAAVETTSQVDMPADQEKTMA